ncbi:MAG: hypothetical protein LBU66_06055, partial [Treponema sp.]|nr:hypothetical protein [Treponema sp.]
QFYVGGFIGDLYSTGIIRNCYSESLVVLNTASDSTDTFSLAAGGFAGRIGLNMDIRVSYCYAKGNVSVLGYNYIYAGGFCGIFNSSAFASFCYAAGNVSAILLGNIEGAFINAGGFAGTARSLSDCYALGEVFVYASSNRAINAGSLVGRINGNGERIYRSFARGDVIVQTTSGTAANINVGGLVGSNRDASTIQNSVSLAGSITVMGFPAPDDAENRRFSRILGMPNTGSNAPTLTNNHAYIDMKLYHKTDPSTIGTTIDLTTVPDIGVVSSANGKDGANVTLGTLRSLPFWEDTLGFDENVTITDSAVSVNNPTGLAADTYPAWNFSTVGARGYPILRTWDGSIMGGQ